MASAVAETTCLKFAGDAKELADRIGVAASVAPSRSTRPVLQSLLLNAHDGVLDVTGSDMEVAICVRIEHVEVMQDGKVLVNAARFLQILRELTGERVEIETNELAGCTIRTADAQFQVMGESAEDYPQQGAWPEEGAFQLKADQFLEMIRRTHFAAHPEKTRYAMNGILLDLKGSRVHLVATDGKRLSMCEWPLDFEVKEPIHVVVPTKGMTLLQRVVQTGEEFVEISVGGSRVFLKTAGAMVSARLVEGHFPPYEEVLPKDHDKLLTLPRESFLCALRRAALLGTKDSQAVRFAFQRQGLELTARVPEVGESRVSFPHDYPYDEMEIGFNPTYFSDLLKVLSTTEFVLELKDAKSAAVIRESGDKGQRYVYLVMPLNLGG
jgi:DNA polymerase III subunit beta